MGNNRRNHDTPPRSGCGCSAHDLESLANQLSETHRILAFDLIGHAQSDDPKTLLGFNEHVDLLGEAAKKLGYSGSTIIGWSYGGWLSMVWAYRHPEEVKRLVVIDIPPVTFKVPTPQDPEDIPIDFRDEVEAADWISERIPLDRVLVKESLKHYPRTGDGRVVTLSHQSRRLNLRKDVDLWEYFRGIEVPILLVYGSDSEYMSEGTVDLMKVANSRLEVVRIQGVGHFIPLSHSNDLVFLVKDWISR
jgi:pimeloyl-ACP methyl ester carboxylesterase